MATGEWHIVSTRPLSAYMINSSRCVSALTKNCSLS